MSKFLPDGVQTVQGSGDPCSNMWSGPVLYHGTWFVTHEHVIVTTRLSICSHLPEDKLPKLVLQYVGVDPFKAKCFGKEMSVRSFLPLWVGEESRCSV